MGEAPDVASRVAALAERAGREVGVEVLRAGLQRVGAARASIVVTIDRPEGVDMEALATMSRALERLLDEEDPIEGAYVLEIESPGERRPLRLPADAARFAGSAVDLRLRGLGGRRRLRGVLVDAGPDAVRVRRNEAGEDEILSVPLADVEEARLHPDAAAPPGAAKGRGGARGAKGRHA